MDHRETNLDDVLQISNVFVNVSKGEVAKHGDLQKAFGKIELSEVVKEVCDIAFVLRKAFSSIDFPRFSRKAKCRLERKSETTNLIRCERRLPHLWPRNALTLPLNGLIPSV